MTDRTHMVGRKPKPPHKSAPYLVRFIHEHAEEKFAAVALSVDEGFKGRLGLHSLPQADAFYRKLGMIDLGQDAAYQNLRYFEMTVEQARAFLEEE